MQDLTGQNYFRISIIQSTSPVSELLLRIKENFEQYQNIKTEWENNPQDPAIYVIYPSNNEFVATYQRELPYFSAFLQIINNHPEFDAKKILSPEIETEKPKEEENYCTLKYETNSKSVLRNYYKYIFQFGQILGMQHEIEEIDNGFLLFYKRVLDFDLSLQNFFQFDDVVAFLREKDLWTLQTQAIAEQVSKLLQSTSLPLPQISKKVSIRKRNSNNRLK